jgi:hypothetical protein
MISEHLAQAERYVSQGGRHIMHQMEFIAELESGGHDTTQAKNLLKLFEELQTSHIADRDRLQKELDEL